MADFLNSLLGDTPDKAQAMSLLAAGLGQRDVLGGLLAASQFMGGAKDRATDREMKQMQMEEARMKMEQMRRAAANEQGLSALMPQYMNPGRPAMGGTADVNAALPPDLQIGAQPAMPGRRPGFDIQGYTQAAMQQRLMNPLQALEMQKKFAPESQINKLDVKDFSPASVAKFNQTGNYGDLERMDKLHFGDTGGALVGLNQFTGKPVNSVPKTGNPFSDLLVSDGQGGLRANSPLIGAKSQIARAGASNVSVTTKQEGEESKAVGKFFGENYADVQKSGFNAQSSMNRLDRLGQLLEGVDTGKFAPLGVEVSKAAQSFGLNIDPKLANKEAAVALSSEIALQLRNPSGGAGMPGAMSDADRNFLNGMVPGIEKTPEGRKTILETAKKMAQRDVQVARMAREYRQKRGTINEGFYEELAKFSEANPLFAGGRAGGGSNIDALVNKYAR